MSSSRPYSIVNAARTVGVLAGVMLVVSTLLAITATTYLDKRNEVYRAVMLYDLLFMEKPTPEAFDAYLIKHRLTPVSGEIIKKIRENGTYLIEDKLIRRTFQSGNIEIFIYGDHYYYGYKMHDMYYYRSDELMTPYLLYIGIAFALLAVLLVMLYRYITGGVKPLKRLHLQIRRFAQGEKRIDTKMEGDDEVAQVANAFHDAVGTIEALHQSRMLFMRNVMHELKTPIGKGKLVVHMLEADPKDKALLGDLFEQMQNHLNDLARIESLTAKHMELERREYALLDIVEQATDRLGLGDDALRHNLLDQKVNVDFNLFAYAIKNLLDNAWKYCDALPVELNWVADTLSVANSGKPLSEAIEHYLQAFTRDSSQHALEGMGLGLYIANSIIERHGFALAYRYEADRHIFSIRFAAQNPED